MAREMQQAEVVRRAQAGAELLPLVYDELRHLAAARLAHERPGQTLQATALVHEAWLRLQSKGDPQWNGEAHFFGAATEAMRRILVENARRKHQLKRGTAPVRVDIDLDRLTAAMPEEVLLALDEALNRLQGLAPEAASLVNLRFFAGLSHQEAAQQLAISRSTADRLWAFARAWLFREIQQLLN